MNVDLLSRWLKALKQGYDAHGSQENFNRTYIMNIQHEESSDFILSHFRDRSSQAVLSTEQETQW